MTAGELTRSAAPWNWRADARRVMFRPDQLVEYLQRIVLGESEVFDMASKTPIEMGGAIVLVRDDGYARDALITRIQEPPDGADAQQAVVDCVAVTDAGAVETHTSILHVDDATPAMTLSWRRTTDHRTSGEFTRESSR